MRTGQAEQRLLMMFEEALPILRDIDLEHRSPEADEDYLAGRVGALCDLALDAQKLTGDVVGQYTAVFAGLNLVVAARLQLTIVSVNPDEACDGEYIDGLVEALLSGADDEEAV